MNSKAGPRRARNDPEQYEDLASTWWDPHGPLAMLHWIAEARGGRIPHASPNNGVLVDLGCGAGTLAPHIDGKGYFHVGVDLSERALRLAVDHGVNPIRADVTAVPLREACADVVSAGEILEHVTDLRATVTEACRLLRPGGLLVIDSIARTPLARVVAIGIAEHIPGGAPKGIHDHHLFVNRRELITICAEHGVSLKLNGLRPSIWGMLGHWFLHRPLVRMVETGPTAVLFQATGRKAT